MYRANFAQQENMEFQISHCNIITRARCRDWNNDQLSVETDSKSKNPVNKILITHRQKKQKTVEMNKRKLQWC